MSNNRYEAAGVTSAAPAIGAAFAELRNTAARRLLVEEIGISLGAATATNIALHRSTAQGAGGTALVGLQEDPNQTAAAASLVMSAFTTAPTFTATAMLRRFSLPGAIGAGVIWTFAKTDRLVIPPSTSLVIATPTIAGAAAINVYVIWVES